MPKLISFRKGVLSVLFWSIISAAFIGPGTVTTASKAGASFGLDLLWPLTFSIVATIVLQEAAARITIGSGKNLGEIIALKYAGKNNQRLKIFLFFAVAFGCAAYEAGNILGSISGLGLFLNIPQRWLTLGVVFAAGSLLWIGNFRSIANLLGFVVALMGAAFLLVAFQTPASGGDLVRGAFLPVAPSGSMLLIIGLIGTTIVPYNLFLASGISRGQSIAEMRIGIGLAVLIGGIISMGILVAGTQVSGTFSFEALGQVMAGRIGPWANGFFGFGLFAAGLSSAITAPLATAVTGQSLFGAGKEEWGVHSRNFRLVWGAILLIGLIFGWTKVQPIPAIILAQAINGVLLPVVAIFLILAVNDKALLPRQYANSAGSNILMLLIVGVTCLLGIHNIGKAVSRIFPALDQMDGNIPWISNVFLTGIILLFLVRQLFFQPSGERNS